MKKLIFTSVLSLSLFQAFGQLYSISGKVLNDQELNQEVEIYLKELNRFFTIDFNQAFEIDSLKPGSYTLTIFSKGFISSNKLVEINGANTSFQLTLQPLNVDLNTIQIEESKANSFGISRLKPVEDHAVYAGKKSEVVLLEDVAANTATNNSRQIYSKVAGLNIWESDDAGIQLGIGGRGLNPNRTSNFNTRQNGYDISADALGYPESYYSPPSEAIERIEIVRGAASLQYGTQFGGFINFKLNDGPEDKKVEIYSRQTLGSFGLYNTFNSIGGKNAKWKYYTYYQFKKGEGWRPNSEFEVHNTHLNVSYQLNPKIKLGVEYTFMNYLAQQAGGLTDVMFERNPFQSIRSRNWFQVNWNLMALHFNYELSDRSKLNFRGFGLLASRDAVGNLGQINRLDNLNTPRDLLSDDYKNWGFEHRFLHRYELFNLNSIFLIGSRYYHGFTERSQGIGSSNSNADFNFKNPNTPEDSKYDFPSQNLAVFTENIFYLTPNISVTPGLRYEWISTNAEGYYFNRFIANNGDTLNNEQLLEERNNNRSFILAGIGFSYKPSEQLELYANFSQNYRSINFNDMRIENPNYEVDPNLKDETGFSADFGIRGNKTNWFNYDISIFLLHYNNRIGNTLIADRQLFRTIRFRTNISDSRSIGIESFGELNLLSLFGSKKSKSSLSIFSNFSWMNATYINSDETAFENKRVELVPEYILKTGISYKRDKFQLSYQYAYVSEQFSDATNAVYTSNAVNGIIPSYRVMDVSAKYNYKKWILECGVNNLSNQIYFTRRASGYPGPGIIPSLPRNYYFTLGVKL